MKKCLLFILPSALLTACVTPLEPVRPDPESLEKESKVENYVDCLRDKRREETDPPCLLE